MLIQLASPFIPLRHIKNGTFGLNGHVCCFDQDVQGFVNTLPRDISDVSMLNVLKNVHTEIGSKSVSTEVYKVRKQKVLGALVWLQAHNREYKHILIDEKALDWLCGPEGTLDVVNLLAEDGMKTIEDEYTDQNADLGPNATTTRETHQSGPHIKTFGFISDAPTGNLSPEDTVIHNEIVQAIDNSELKKDIHVSWPCHGPVAISEFSATRIFARAFPWLFPGGYGDVKDFPCDVGKWGEYLLYYEDGRFAKDKYFCFYALNYITRHRNAKSGNWFVHGFNAGGPQNLQELKDSIKNGDTRFVNRLTYFNKRVKGSTAYFLQHRAQVYSWINYLLEIGKGPPMFFITLSCGEYYWPDIFRLMKERLKIANDPRHNQVFAGSKSLTGIINDYSIVIQEYFQKRVSLWMEHVGLPIFGIVHYWGRFEFAPGRGQIHIHLLGVIKDQAILQLCHDDLKDTNGKEKRANRIANWAKDNFGLTASVNDGFDNIQQNPSNSPCSIRFSDLQTDSLDSTSALNDQQKLMKYCQVHECNGFCMRKRNNQK